MCQFCGEAMNHDESKDFLIQFRANQAQPGSPQSSISSSSSSSSDATTQPPTPQPPPQLPSTLRPPASPNSSAPTVSPPHSPPPSPPPPPLSTASHPQSPHTPRARTSSQPPRRQRTPSPASSASTVPPPSPGALNRITNRTIPRTVTVSVSREGIYGLPEEHTTSTSDILYPKLQEVRFTPDEHSSDDLVLSNRGMLAPHGVLPANILKFLSPFQRDGVTFMYRLYERGRGGLLADAMGLGKTVQTVCFLGAAFAVWNRESRPDEPAPRILVVAPASVRENWKREFESWTPFRVVLYERTEEPNIGRNLRDGTIDVLITGDNPIATSVDRFFSNPTSHDSNWEWDVVIVDEIHVAKNKNTKVFHNLQALPKKVMFGLTGTAVQNRLKELWNVMSLVVPETLWPSYKSYKADYIDIINKGTKKDASEYMRRKAHERISKLRNLLAKHMVRRPKSVIESQLPGKTDYCVLMRMKRDGLQGYMYQRFQNSYDVKMLRDALLPCDCDSGALSKACCHRFPTTEENRREAPIWSMAHKNGPCDKCPNCICLYVQHFSRWLAAHVLLVLPGDEEPDREKAAARAKIFQYYLGERRSLENVPAYRLERDAILSCKLNVALKLIKTYEANGNKTIVFYESLRLGEILQRWAENNRLKYEIIDGSVAKGRRQGVVDRFNTESDISTFFISKKAGATGLNICGADRVLIFEPCWNPTLDLQAGDRAYRLGQKRVVHIIRLVVENTIEHYVFKTALSKSQISSAILDNTREEWLVRDDEVGSIHAMLSMGDVFQAEDEIPDDFKVIEAERLSTNGKRRSDGSGDSDSVLQDTQEEPDSLREGVPPELDRVIGKDGMCSLEVDLDYEDVAQLSTDNEDPGEGRYDCVPTESQFDTDMLLEEGGASKKLVMQSTSASKRRRQMMGVSESHRLSGINPDGASNVNFDAPAGEDSSMSMETREEKDEDSWGEHRVTGRPHRRAAKTKKVNVRNAENERAVLDQQEEEESSEEPIFRRRSTVKAPRPRDVDSQRQRDETKTKGIERRRKDATMKEKPAKTRGTSRDQKLKKAPVSAFAARARVRR